MIVSIPGTGWIPDVPSAKDYSVSTPKVQTLLLGKEVPLPDSVDLREHFTPIYDQGAIQSCTAHAATALLEYFYSKAIGQKIGTFGNASRMFLYKVTRNLLNQPTADKGAFLRTTMEAMRLIGVPPENVWPYLPDNLYVEPPAFIYSLADNYKATTYFRLDPEGTRNGEVLFLLKKTLSQSLPVMFGTLLYSSLGQAVRTGKIPYPLPGDSPVGAHAIVAVGYDNKLVIENTNSTTGGRSQTIGAVRIRNSWGRTWGDGGYGWLPYDYILNGNADDYWCLVKAAYIDRGQFDISGKAVSAADNLKASTEKTARRTPVA